MKNNREYQGKKQRGKKRSANMLRFVEYPIAYQGKNKMNDKSGCKKEKFLHLDTPLDLYGVGNQANSSFLNRMISQTITGVNKRGQLSRS